MNHTTTNPLVDGLTAALRLSLRGLYLGDGLDPAMRRDVMRHGEEILGLAEGRLSTVPRDHAASLTGRIAPGIEVWEASVERMTADECAHRLTGLGFDCYECKGAPGEPEWLISSRVTELGLRSATIDGLYLESMLPRE
jgi:hypothetical protein